MGSIVVENTIHARKRPLHSALDGQPCRGVAAAAAGTTMTTSTNKRGKVFPFRPASVVVVEPPPPACAPSRDCPTVVADTAAFERDENATPVVGPPAPSPAGGLAAAVTAPTAYDYANLLFCESSEEEETRANLLADGAGGGRACPCPCPSDDAVVAAATAATRTRTRTRTKTRGTGRRKRLVSFGASIPAVHLLRDVPPSHAMTPDERSASWFSRSDLEGLKSDARSSVREMRGRVLRSPAPAATTGADRPFRAMMAALEEETDSSVRGLEHRVFRRRHARRALVRDVLECQAHVRGLAKFGHEVDRDGRGGGGSGTSISLLARVSRERSTKARFVAFVDARDDYEEAYRCGGGDRRRADADVDAWLCEQQKKQVNG